jgi:hypothetical protein
MGQSIRMQSKLIHRVVAGCGLWLAAASSQAAIEIVDEFLSPVPVSPVAEEWYVTQLTAGGSASIQSLVGLGGDLENNQPLPIGAALLTTDLTNPARAEVATFKNFGLAREVLNGIDLAYSYYKQTVADGNIFAAPAIKLSIFSPGGTGDNFGQLVFEPYLNGTPVPPADAWQSIVIDESTGGGGDVTLGWWWTGGFEIPSSIAGPPYRSLAEWAAAFNTSDPTDFATAAVTAISIGVGTFNPGQMGYFDEVSYAIGGGAVTTYDFEPAAAVPEPFAFLVWTFGGGLALAAAARRRLDS